MLSKSETVPLHFCMKDFQSEYLFRTCFLADNLVTSQSLTIYFKVLARHAKKVEYETVP